MALFLVTVLIAVFAGNLSGAGTSLYPNLPNPRHLKDYCMSVNCFE